VCVWGRSRIVRAEDLDGGGCVGRVQADVDAGDVKGERVERERCVAASPMASAKERIERV